MNLCAWPECREERQRGRGHVYCAEHSEAARKRRAENPWPKKFRKKWRRREPDTVKVDESDPQYVAARMAVRMMTGRE